MKKFISVFLLAFMLFGSTTHAFWWDRQEQNLPEKPQDIWNDPFFDDPFFSYHRNFMNRWQSPLWDFSFPRISIANSYPLDLEEQENQLVATIDIPHFDSEDIEVEVKNDRWLIVQGKKSANESKDNEDKKYYYRERSSGSFMRQVMLPYPVDKTKTTAEFQDGSLVITLPEKEIAPEQDDKINIQVK